MVLQVDRGAVMQIQIVFYEKNNFQGRKYENTVDCTDLEAMVQGPVSSVRIESGTWVLYERKDFTGTMHVLSPGEFADPAQWQVQGEQYILSCRILRQASGGHRIRLYEKAEFAGDCLELSEDCPVLEARWGRKDVQSVRVVSGGAWVAYEEPEYRGRQYCLERGEYRKHQAWGATAPRVQSLRRFTEC
ncbi:unnamed protein product [Lampetra planeri]